MFLAHMPNFLPIENYSLFDPPPKPKKKKKKFCILPSITLLLMKFDFEREYYYKCNALSLPIFNLTIIYWLEKK